MWYVVQTASGQEEKAMEQCGHAVPTNAAGAIFSPTCECMKKYQGTWHMEVQRLFPGYVFIDSERPEELEKYLKRIPGAVIPVRIGGGFYPIRKEEQEFLQDMLDESYCLRFSIGNIVDGELIVEQGPLCKKAVYVQKIDRHRRSAQVLFRLFGEERPTRVGLEVKARLTAEEYQR